MGDIEFRYCSRQWFTKPLSKPKHVNGRVKHPNFFNFLISKKETMKKILFCMAMWCMAHPALVFSQNLTFVYYDKQQVITTNFNGSAASSETGYRAITVTPQNEVKFKSIASANLLRFYNAITTKTSRLRKSVDRLTKISQKTITTIEFHLINDRTGLPTVAEDNEIFCRSYDANLNISIAWPCAGNAQNTGYVFFGEISAGSSDFESTVIHELSHTQSLKNPNGNNSKYGKDKNGKEYDYVKIAYGGDDGHYRNELQGDQQQAMDEAFGNFWGGIHDTIQRVGFLAQYDTGQEFLLGSHSKLTGTSEMWNAKHRVLVQGVVPAVQSGEKHPTFRAEGYELVLISTHLIQGQSRYIARLYKYVDVPRDYLYNSEALVEMYLYMMHQYAFHAPDTAINKITDFAKYYAATTDHQRHRYPFNMALYFASTLEKYNKVYRENPQTKSHKFVSSIFPLALYDVLMHFGLSDADLKRKFEIATYSIAGVAQITKPKAVDVYMAKRNEIKALLCPFMSGNKDCKDSNTNMSIVKAVQELQKYCMTSSILTSTNL